MNHKKSICFIAQFPPPMNGLTKAVETLYCSHLNREFEFEMVDIKSNKAILSTLIRIVKSDADLFYFTISQSKAGNWRDLLIMKLLSTINKKCVVHLHGGYYRTLVDNKCGRLQRLLNYKAIKGLSGVIVLSDSLKYIFKGMIDDNKIFVVPNCVDDQFLMSQERFKAKLDTLPDKKVINILYLSNFIESKGYREVLKLAKVSKDRGNKNFKFKFAGKFFEEKEKVFFESYIRDNQLENLVEYKGIVHGEDKNKLLNESDVFILLTHYPNEGQPISILEAMGNGMAIFTTDYAGIPDIVSDGENGFLYDPHMIDVKKIYEKLEAIFNEREIFIKIVQKNRERVINEYLESKYINNIQRIFC